MFSFVRGTVIWLSYGCWSFFFANNNIAFGYSSFSHMSLKHCLFNDIGLNSYVTSYVGNVDAVISMLILGADRNSSGSRWIPRRVIDFQIFRIYGLASCCGESLYRSCAFLLEICSWEISVRWRCLYTRFLRVVASAVIFALLCWCNDCRWWW